MNNIEITKVLFPRAVRLPWEPAREITEWDMLRDGSESGLTRAYFFYTSPGQPPMLLLREKNGDRCVIINTGACICEAKMGGSVIRPGLAAGITGTDSLAR